MSSVQKTTSKSYNVRSPICQTPKNVLVMWAVILLFVIAGSGAVITQQMKNNNSSVPSSTTIPVTSSAPLQMRYFDLNSLPMTVENSDEVFAQNDEAISSVFANNDEDVRQLNQINTQEDAQGL